MIQSPAYAAWLAAPYQEKARISDELCAAVQWKDDGVYIIGDLLEYPEGPQFYPMYLCSLDEEGNPWLGVICSLISPDPEDWERPFLTPITEVYPQN